MTPPLQTLPLKLGLEDSRRLLAELDNQELPWELRSMGADLIFEVWIDGSPSAHSLDLNNPSGWCMRTHVPI